METIVIGAGLAGLQAATLLRSAGHHVTVLDKGRRHGGRMATRRVDDAVFDTGVLDLAAHGPSFRRAIGAWVDAGAGARASREGDPPRWRGAPMMRSLPTAIGEACTASHAQGGATTTVPAVVRLATTVTDLHAKGGRWQVAVKQDGRSELLSADALVITAPAPQTLALLRTGDHLADDATLALLESVAYVPCLTVLARPVDRTVTSGDLPVGGLDGAADGDLDRIHHNERTGASPVVALTLQATAAFSAAHLDGDRAAAAATLAVQAAGTVGVDLEVVHVHGWRFAQVQQGIELPALRDDAAGAPLVLGGDLFVAHGEVADNTRTEGVERAFLSGVAAAGLLLAG